MRKIFRRFSCERERFRLPFGKIAGPAHASCARCRPEASAAKVFGECRQAGNAGDAEGRLGRGAGEPGREHSTGELRSEIRRGEGNGAGACCSLCRQRVPSGCASRFEPACRRGMSSAAGGSGSRRVCPRRNRARNRGRGQSRPRPSENAAGREMQRTPEGRPAGAGEPGRGNSAVEVRLEIR